MKKKKKLKLKKPRVIIMSGYGLNCEEETKFAFEKAGAKEKVSADIVHINDLIKKPKMLSEYQILAFPGGFSYGDDTGSGKAYANKFKNHLLKELKEFLSRDTLAIGICNGFQIMTNLGILPGALSQNKGGKYLDRWVDLKVTGRSPWLSGIKKISVPIAHGEGCYVIRKKEYKKMSAKGGSASGGKCSKLIIHSPTDETVPFEYGRALYEKASEPKTFLEIQGDHNSGFISSGDVYVNGLKSFLDRWVR